MTCDQDFRFRFGDLGSGISRIRFHFGFGIVQSFKKFTLRLLLRVDSMLLDSFHYCFHQKVKVRNYVWPWYGWAADDIRQYSGGCHIFVYSPIPLHNCSTEGCRTLKALSRMSWRELKKGDNVDSNIAIWLQYSQIYFKIYFTTMKSNYLIRKGKWYDSTINEVNHTPEHSFAFMIALHTFVSQLRSSFPATHFHAVRSVHEMEQCMIIPWSRMLAVRL